MEQSAISSTSGCSSRHPFSFSSILSWQKLSKIYNTAWATTPVSHKPADGNLHQNFGVWSQFVVKSKLGGLVLGHGFHTIANAAESRLGHVV